MRRTAAIATTAFLIACTTTTAFAAISSRVDDVARIQAAERIFHQIVEGAGHGVAEQILEGGQCVAIIPGNKSFALGIGGIYGKGIATCRNANGVWGAPIFITIGGASIGYQIGGESADMVLVFQNMNGLESMLNNKVRLGVQASAAAGPVGRQMAASTDASMHAQVQAYAHSRGLYIGVNLNGAIVQPDETGNRAMYGHAFWQDVLAGRVAAPAEARVLLTTLNTSPYTNPIVMARIRGNRGPAATPAGAAKTAFGPPVQPLLHFSAGIAYTHQRTTIGLDGFDINLGVRPLLYRLPGLKLVADVSRVRGSQALLGASVTNSEWTYLVGPEFDVPRRLFTPYGHVLFGEGHLNTSTTASTGTTTAGAHSYAWEIGGGLRLRPARNFSIQIVQLDFLHTSFNNSGSTNARLSFGIEAVF